MAEEPSGPMETAATLEEETAVPTAVPVPTPEPERETERDGGLGLTVLALCAAGGVTGLSLLWKRRGSR